jgi:hypothetical protein
MYGLEAINYYNGWAMAIAGGLIVMTGLAVLALVIAQLHRVVELLQQKPKAVGKTEAATKEPIPQKPYVPDTCPANIAEAARQYQPLVDRLGDAFQLSELYELAEQHGLAHPHLTIRCLREKGILAPRGEGLFEWLRP